MTTTLNNYTIDDFLKLKPIIYEYCCNLTQKKNTTSWYRDFSAADDLYQDLYIYVYDNYFNKPKEPIVHEQFVQRMKNLTFYAHHKNYTKKGSKIVNNVNYFQDTLKSEFLFESTHYEEPLYFENIQDHPDYNFYMKNLKFEERLAVQYFLKGYTKAEVAKMFNKNYAYIPNIVKKINANFLSDKFNKPVIKKPVKNKIIVNDLVFVREKVSNFEKVFLKKKGKSLEDDRKIKMYSLYLQGVPGKKIALMLNKSYHQIGQEIFRINQKIKKYDSESLSIS